MSATSPDTADAVMHAPVLPIALQRPGVPIALSDAVTRALLRDPEQRYATVGEFAATVRAAAGAPPAVALGDTVQRLFGRELAETHAMLAAHLGARPREGTSRGAPTPVPVVRPADREHTPRLSRPPAESSSPSWSTCAA